MYVAIEGVIGVGKTTLARLLRPMLEAEILLEIFEENPFLSDFYSDRARYAFQTQIFFLLSRYHQQRGSVPEMLAAGRSVIADYTFAKDALFARINLKGDELTVYHRVHEALGEKIPRPDLIVYLRADTDVLDAAHCPARPAVRTQHGAGVHRRCSTTPTRISLPSRARIRRSWRSTPTT